jgi:hypothetical protein
MKRTLFLLAACVLSAGCQSRARVCLTEDQARGLNLSFTDALAADSHDSVFLITRGNVVRYDPGRHEVEYLLRQGRAGLADLAVARDDVLLALDRAALHAVFAGELVEVLKLPGAGLRASCHGDHVYVLVRTASGERGLLRYGFDTKQIEPLLLTREPVSAICAVPGGCLFASGGSLYKLFVPPAESAPAGPREVSRVLLLAMAGKEIVSVAADAEGRIVYFAAPRMTYAWAKQRVVPLFPVGGQVRCCGGRLTIASPDMRQVVQLVSPASRVRRMLDRARPAVLSPAPQQATAAN